MNAANTATHTATYVNSPWQMTGFYPQTPNSSITYSAVFASDASKVDYCSSSLFKAGTISYVYVADAAPGVPVPGPGTQAVLNFVMGPYVVKIQLLINGVLYPSATSLVYGSATEIYSGLTVCVATDCNPYYCSLGTK